MNNLLVTIFSKDKVYYCIVVATMQSYEKSSQFYKSICRFYVIQAFFFKMRDLLEEKMYHCFQLELMTPKYTRYEHLRTKPKHGFGFAHKGTDPL